MVRGVVVVIVMVVIDTQGVVVVVIDADVTSSTRDVICEEGGGQWGLRKHGGLFVLGMCRG